MKEAVPKIENKEQKKKRILVVDDDKSILAGIEATLDMLGYEVATVSDGISALRKLLSGEFNALITDYNLGAGINGLELLKKIRENESLKHLPAILNSGDENLELKQETQKLGAKFIKKPYSFDILEEAMKEILE